MRTALISVAVSLTSGCGAYIHTGGGGYTFIGPGSHRLGNRCSPYAQWSLWRPTYDYEKMRQEIREGK